MAATTTRQTAEQRRDTVLDAAMIEFGLKGLHGASTDDIARLAGISQPYLFRLFRTKRDLFLASVERCFRRTAGRPAQADDADAGLRGVQRPGRARHRTALLRAPPPRGHGHVRRRRGADPHLVFDRHVPERDGGDGRAVRAGRLDAGTDGRPDAGEAQALEAHSLFYFASFVSE